MKDGKRIETYILGEIKADVMQRVLLAAHLSVQAGVGMRVWICSRGGDLMPALAVYDALKRHPDSEAIATGECQSAALVALLGARRRLATPNTLFWNHEIKSECGMAYSGVMLPALDSLDKLPKGHFGPAAALECGLIHFVSEEMALPDAELLHDETDLTGLLTPTPVH